MQHCNVRGRTLRADRCKPQRHLSGWWSLLSPPAAACRVALEAERRGRGPTTHDMIRDVSVAATTSEIPETCPTCINGSQPALAPPSICTSVCVRPRRRTQKKKWAGIAMCDKSIHHRVWAQSHPRPAYGRSFVCRYYHTRVSTRCALCNLGVLDSWPCVFVHARCRGTSGQARAWSPEALWAVGGLGWAGLVPCGSDSEDAG